MTKLTLGRPVGKCTCRRTQIQGAFIELSKIEEISLREHAVPLVAAIRWRRDLFLRHASVRSSSHTRDRANREQDLDAGNTKAVTCAELGDVSCAQAERNHLVLVAPE